MPGARVRRIALVGVLGVLLAGSFTSSAGAGPDGGFHVTGQPIQPVEAEDAESASSSADTVPAGRYQLELGASDTGQWVAVEKHPGTSLWVTLVTRIPDDEYDDELWLEIETPDGDECAATSAEASSEDGYRGPAPIGVVVDPATVDSDEQSGCFNARKLMVEVGQEDDEAEGLAAELHVLEEPKVANGHALPEGESDSDELDPRWNGAARASAIAGAGSFVDAPAVGNGRYADTIRPGGVRLYRVDPKFGQRVRAVVNVPAVPPGDAARLSDDMDVGVSVFGPARQFLTTASEPTSDESSVTFGTTTPTLRYRNRESDDSAIAAASLAGPHYVLVTARADEASIPLPYELEIRVTGKANGAPRYTGAGAPQDKPDDTDREAAAGESATEEAMWATIEWPVAGPILAGLAAALLVCLIGLALRRRS